MYEWLLLMSIWLAILWLMASILILRKWLRDLETIVSGMEERFGRRLAAIEYDRRTTTGNQSGGTGGRDS